MPPTQLRAVLDDMMAAYARKQGRTFKKKLKLRLGRGEEIRRCLFTNYCEGLDQSHQAVTCQLWDRVKGLDDDSSVIRASDGRRLLAPEWNSPPHPRGGEGDQK